MVAFLRKHRNFVLSLCYLLLALALAGYSVIYYPREVAIADMAEMQRIFSREAKPLREAAQILKQQQGQQTEVVGIRSLPAFLGHINRVAQDTNVIITELVPAQDREQRQTAELKFQLRIAENYLTFLRFAARLESLNLGINDLQVRPFDATKNPPVHAISFSITPRNDAEPTSSQRIDNMKDQVAAQDKRNPFQRFAYNPKSPKPNPWIDLTWVHRLTGIGRVGDKRMATIDSREYAAGDNLSGMTITSVESDRVMLNKTTENGRQIYVLGFRAPGAGKPKS